MTAPAPNLPRPDDRPRFLSETDCHDIAQRLARYARGGGYAGVLIASEWRGDVRWARNLVSIASDVRTNHISIGQDVQGATSGWVMINETSDAALVSALRRAERLTQFSSQYRDSDLITHILPEPASAPQLFSEATYQLDAEQRTAAASQLAKTAAAAGMLSAGYIAVSAHSLAFITSWGLTRYFQYTWARYSVTVRDPQGTGSGWAGVDWPDWAKIDAPALTQRALDKCLQSRNPVAIEPGRYTTILEPQAVCDFVCNLMPGLSRFRAGNPTNNETSANAPFNADTQGPGHAKLGEKVVDERITIGADPMDPELGFPPFGIEAGENELFNLVDLPVYHPVTWIEHGVLTNLEYDRFYGMNELGKSLGLRNSGAFRMSGGVTSVEEMIATTKRGLLVTRFDKILELNFKSLLYRGYTRDGLWLIENGKITKPVRNLAFTESILFALNNIEQLGPPQRTFHPPEEGVWTQGPQPVIVPPLKVRDFSFTALVDAV